MHVVFPGLLAADHVDSYNSYIIMVRSVVFRIYMYARINST